MSASAVTSLRRAVRTALIADQGLIDMLGGAHVFDGVPRGVGAPYIAFGDAEASDWSTSSDRGIEQILAIEIWSDQPGARQALGIGAEVECILRDAGLVLEDHYLVDLTFVSLETRRTDDGRLQRATLRFRAVTEAL